MASFTFSNRARADLLNIAAYTLERWGEGQAQLYLDQLEMCAQRLADNHLLGRPCNHVRDGLLRVEQGSHVVLFRRVSPGVVMVCRIMHNRRMVELHPIDDSDPET